MSDPVRVRAVVVDDEAPARAQLATLLGAETDVELVGEAGGATAAVALIRAERPDLVFLDIEMPGGDGFSVLRAVAPDLPMVVFVTAYDQHAIEAFEFAALDYLLKPVIQSRFHLAVRRAVTRIREARAGELSARVAALLERVSSPGIEQIPLWTDGRVVFVRVTDIDWIDAADDYVRVHVGSTVYTTRETMSAMESRLPSGFLRVHRSYIVNRSRIREIQPWVKGDFVIILQNGARVTTGRTYRERVRSILPPSSASS
jgi:two-component system LytT family response regulator